MKRTLAPPVRRSLAAIVVLLLACIPIVRTDAKGSFGGGAGHGCGETFTGTPPSGLTLAVDTAVTLTESYTCPDSGITMTVASTSDSAQTWNDTETGSSTATSTADITTPGTTTVDVTLTVTGTSLGTLTYNHTYSITINPAVPTLQNPASESINEGDTAGSDGTWNAAVSNTTAPDSATVDYGDGSGAQPATITQIDASDWQIPLSHTYAYDGTYPVIVNAYFGGQVTSAWATVTVNEVDPSGDVQLTAGSNPPLDYAINDSSGSVDTGQTVQEGDTISLHMLDANDPNGPTPFVSCDANGLDPGFVFVFPPYVTDTSCKAYYYPSTGTMTVLGSVSSGYDLDYNLVNPTIHVTNVPPTVTSINTSRQSSSSGFAVSAAGTFTDPGIGAYQPPSAPLEGGYTGETYTAQWDWGDGTTSTGTLTVGKSSGSVADTHTYASPGTYIITLTVSDGTDSGTLSTPQLNSESITTASVTGSPTGCSSTFTPATVTLTTSVPVSATYYQIDNSPWIKYTRPFQVKNAGVHTVRYYSVDTSGTEEFGNSQQVQVGPTIKATTPVVYYGMPIPLTGASFLQNEPVNVYLDNTSGTPLNGSTPLSADGSCALNASVPAPDALYGKHTLIAVGESSGQQAQTSVQYVAHATSAPNFGMVGASSTVTGYDFPANDTVNLTMHDTYTGLDTPVGSGVADGQGTVTIPFTVPQVEGVYYLLKLSDSSGIHTQTGFTVTPNDWLTPNKGAQGSSVTITGNGFKGAYHMIVDWNCGPSACSSPQQLVNQRMNNDGSFSIQFNVPTGIAPGWYTLKTEAWLFATSQIRYLTFHVTS